MRGTILIVAVAATLTAAGISARVDWSSERLKAAVSAYEAGNYRLAKRRLTDLANHGSAIAETMLGNMYAKGEISSGGAPGMRRPAIAAAYYYRAATRGYGPAQIALSDAYAKGYGVPASLNRAYYWALLADRAGGEHVRAEANKRIAELAEQLSQTEMSNLASEARSFRRRARRAR